MNTYGRYFLVVALVLMVCGCGGGEESESKGSAKERLEEAKQITDPATRTTTLLQVAKEANESASIDTFESALFLAQQACKDIRDARRRTEAYAAVATMLHENGKKNDARDLIKEIDKSFGDIKEPVEKASAATKLAKLYGVTLGNERAATSILEQGVSAAKEIEDPTFHVTALAELVTTFDELGMLTERDTTIDDVLIFTRSLSDSRKKADGLKEIAVGLSKLDGIPASVATTDGLMEEAIGVSATIGDANSRSFALIGIAKSAKELDLMSQARQAFSAAESAAEEITVQSDKNSIMRELDRIRDQFAE